MAQGMVNMAYDPNATAIGLDRLGEKINALGTNAFNQRMDLGKMQLAAQGQRNDMEMSRANAELAAKKFEYEKWQDTPMTMEQAITGSMALDEPKKQQLLSNFAAVEKQAGFPVLNQIVTPREMGKVWQTVSMEVARSKAAEDQFNRQEKSAENRFNRQETAAETRARLQMEQDAQQFGQRMSQDAQQNAAVLARMGATKDRSLEDALVRSLGDNPTKEQIQVATDQYYGAKADGKKPLTSYQQIQTRLEARKMAQKQVGDLRDPLSGQVMVPGDDGKPRPATLQEAQKLEDALTQRNYQEATGGQEGEQQAPAQPEVTPERVNENLSRFNALDKEGQENYLYALSALDPGLAEALTARIDKKPDVGVKAKSASPAAISHPDKKYQSWKEQKIAAEKVRSFNGLPPSTDDYAKVYPDPLQDRGYQEWLKQQEVQEAKKAAFRQWNGLPPQ